MEIADVRRQVEMSGPADQRELPLCRAAWLHRITTQQETNTVTAVGWGSKTAVKQDAGKVKSASRSEMDHHGATVRVHFSVAAIGWIRCPSVPIAG